MKKIELCTLALICIGQISTANVIEIKGLDQLNKEVLQSSKPAIIKVSSPGCGPCVRSKKPYEALSQEPAYADIVFAEVNADSNSNSDIVKKYNVQSLPTFIFIKDGQEVNRTSGYSDNFKKEMNAELDALKVGSASVAPEKKTEKSMAIEHPKNVEESEACPNIPDNFFERAYDRLKNFFSSIVDAIHGWFK